MRQRSLLRRQLAHNFIHGADAKVEAVELHSLIDAMNQSFAARRVSTGHEAETRNPFLTEKVTVGKAAHQRCDHWCSKIMLASKFGDDLHCFGMRRRNCGRKRQYSLTLDRLIIDETPPLTESHFRIPTGKKSNI